MKLGENLPEMPDISALLQLASSLGMVESTITVELRESIAEAMRDPAMADRARELYAIYEKHLDQMLEFLPGVAGQLGAQLLKAAIFRAAGNEEYCDEFLYDAIVDAANAGLGSVADGIRVLRMG